MNVNDDNTEPSLTNLRRSLGLPSQFPQRRLSNDSSSGAGANAAAATDPLLELVWSPHNGLLLKRAGSRLIPQRSYLFGKDSKKTMSGSSLKHKSQVGESSHGRPNEGKEFNSREKEGSDPAHGIGDAGDNYRKLDLENELQSETNTRKRRQCKASDISNACPKSSGGKVHSSHENNISVGESPTSSRIQRYRRKGKEKVLSDGDLNTNPPPENNDDNDSHESVESCNHRTGLFLKGKKIWEGRRLEQNHDSHGSTSFVRRDSSFVSWISNMMKAFPKPNKETTAPLALTLAKSSENLIIAPMRDPDPEFQNTGFQKMFKLICSRDTKAREEICISDDGVCGVNATPLACFAPNNQLLLTSEQCDQSATHKSGADSSAKSKNDEILHSLDSDTKKNGVSLACSSLGKRKATSDSINGCIRKTDPLESSWITRFSHKISGPSPLTKPHLLEQERKLEAGVNSGDNPVSGYKSEASVGLTGGVQFGNELKSSEAMSSIFARRLDALKHILPSEPTRSSTCFFCGENGHDLKDCLEITETELDDLVKNLHSHDGAEESPRLCIKCFQLSHWAVSCPNVSSSSKRKKSEDFGSQMSLMDKVVSPSKVGQKEHSVRQILDVPKGVFDAIRRLRLSRTSILKWTNSQIPLSRLDGFYLRLRLGKWEGLGGTGYYVGRINGAQDESLPKGSGSAIPVSIGGMKCTVESQYVSNQDFLEDELAAWWSLTIKSGGSIPSEGDVRQKVEEGKKLGF